LPDDIDSTLKNVVAHSNIKDVSIVQQHDGYNCGIFAFENARIINDKIQSD
jgi:Ulp1 family protease